jgi:actin
LLGESGFHFPTPAEKEEVATVKETLCYVALDFDEEMTNSTKTAKEERYTMPDGTVLRVGNPAFRCAEALFKPQHLGAEADPLHEVVYKAITKCDASIRRDLYSNIVLAGGTTMLRHLPARLEKEVGNLAPSAVKPKVVAPPERVRSVWLGGSMLSSLPQFQQLWISKREYEEHGPGVAFHRCFV